MPDSGMIYQLPVVKTLFGHTELAMEFEPHESFFVVFREPGEASAQEAVP
jgi:hypothetical protein